MEYLTEISAQLGISMWLLIVIIIWSLCWKIAALWKSARKGSWIWFIALMLVNTIGILEILYIYVFSEMGSKKATPTKRARTKKTSAKGKSARRKR